MPANLTKRRVLVAGASGAVGQELLRQLAADPTIEPLCLLHRSQPTDAVLATVRADATRPQLGLSTAQYLDLVHGVDEVVNVATATGAGTGRPRPAVVDCTVRLAKLAAHAGVPYYHLSLACPAVPDDSLLASSATRYVTSAREAEDAVRAADIPHAVLRPSIIVGNSRTGAISGFGGFYQMAARFLRGRLPVIPFAPDAVVDLVPVDYVAAAVSATVRARAIGAEHWITYGPAALTLGDVIRIGLEVAHEFGYAADPPTLLWGRTLERAWASVTDPAARAELTGQVAYFAAHISTSGPLPTSHPDLAALGVGTPPEPAEIARRSLRYWARRDTASWPAEHTFA